MDVTPADARDASAGLRLSRIPRARTRERISDRVHDELAAAIRDLRLRPGATLSETDLAEQFGVSRTPLREAISRLADQGLVIVTPQVATRVSPIDLGEVEEATFIRSALETAAFRRACLADADAHLLRTNLDGQEEAFAQQNPERFFELDEEFHQEIFRLAGFPHAWTVVRSAKLQLDRVRRLVVPQAIRNRTLIEEHTRIADLLERRDGEAGSLAVAEHALQVLELAPAIRAEFPEYFS